MTLHKLKSLLDQITYVVIVFLAVVNAVAEVLVAMSEQIHYGQDLTIVGYEGLSYSI